MRVIIGPHRLAGQLCVPEGEAVGRGGVRRCVDEQRARRALKEARRQTGRRVAPAHVPQLWPQLRLSAAMRCGLRLDKPMPWPGKAGFEHGPDAHGTCTVGALLHNKCRAISTHPACLHLLCMNQVSLQSAT